VAKVPAAHLALLALLALPVLRALPVRPGPVASKVLQGLRARLDLQVLPALLPLPQAPLPLCVLCEAHARPQAASHSASPTKS
jgi:hypothetical protein